MSNTTSVASSEVLGFDPDALRDKYRQERDRRMRTDGNAQYREVQGELRGFVDDPHVAPGFTREPIHEELEIAIIGGGFGGLVAAARLRSAGFADIRVIENINVILAILLTVVAVIQVHERWDDIRTTISNRDAGRSLLKQLSMFFVLAVMGLSIYALFYNVTPISKSVAIAVFFLT